MYAHSEDERDALIQDNLGLEDVSDHPDHIANAEKQLGSFTEDANQRQAVLLMTEAVQQAVDSGQVVELSSGVTIVPADQLVQFLCEAETLNPELVKAMQWADEQLQSATGTGQSPSRQIELNEGKYTYVFEESTGKQYALRYGETWRDLTGDNLVYWLGAKIEDQAKEIEGLRAAYDVVQGSIKIIREAAAIIAAVKPEHAPDCLRFPIVDELEGFASILAAPAGSASAFSARDPSKPAEQQGLFQKFIIRRIDGTDQPGGKHAGCRYFVLDLTHDEHSPAAMRAYAAACKATHPDLAADIEKEFNPSPELSQDWFFSFGSSHAHPHGYVKIYGTHSSAREEMVRRYGNQWAFQYSAEKFANQIRRFFLYEVKELG